MMDVSTAIKTKRAVRQFTDQPLPEAVIRAILNAGRRAQSAKNTQPWQFMVVTDPEKRTALSKLGQYAGHLAGAPCVVAILTPDPEGRWSVMFDAGQAAAYMQLAAWNLGVGSVPATIYEPEQARAVLGFPAEWHLRVCFSFGYPADPAALTAPNRPGGRAPLDSIIHWDTW